jgi:opine dehydrogenase
VLGAGAIGPACAVLAASRGHAAVLWSPSGAGTRGVGDALEAEGTIAGRFPVEVAPDLAAALAGADAALIVVPAYALGALLPRVGPALPAGMPVLIAPAASLAPLVLDRLRAAAPGPTGALATTPCTARRLGPARVRVGAIRAALEIGAVPAAAAPELAALCHALFGNAYPTVPDALAAALINVNPIAHAALALANATRIETGETWSQYAMMTPAVCRLMEGMAAERDALAAAFGHRLPGLVTHFERANGVPAGPLPEMMRAIAAGRGAVLGPTTMDTRYVTEDVPFGLAFYLALAASAGVPMPLTEGAVRVLEALWGRDLRANDLLAQLDLRRLPALLRDGHAGGAEAVRPCSP